MCSSDLNDWTKIWMGIIDTAGNMLTEKTFLPDSVNDVQCNRLIKNNEGNFVLAGTYHVTNSGNTYHPFILKINQQGDSLWMRFFHKNINVPVDDFYDIKQTYDNGYIIAGNTYSDSTLQDAWLLKVDCMGFDTAGACLSCAPECYISTNFSATICAGDSFLFHEIGRAHV